jgi:transposase
MWPMLCSASAFAWSIAAHARHLPARKSDVSDCQWLAQLHQKKLLNSGFVPPALVRALRDYTRLRQDHIRCGSSHLLHMQKALDQMNIKIHEVISLIPPKTARNLDHNIDLTQI